MRRSTGYFGARVMGNEPNSLDKTLALLLRPISKLLIDNNVPIQNAIEALKRAMVSAAGESTETTDSHVSLKTGVHRKDVRRIRAETGEMSPGKRTISPIPLVMTYWAKTPPFCDSAGCPLDLPRFARTGVTSFDALVRASKVDLPPATVLGELLSQGLVAEQPDGTLRLLTTTYIPTTDSARLAAFDATMSDHIRIAVQNATSPADAPRDFDQVLRYSQLSEASVARLEAKARAAANDYLEALNALAHDLQQNDDTSGAAHKGRFVTGVFIAPTNGDDPEKGTDE